MTIQVPNPAVVLLVLLMVGVGLAVVLALLYWLMFGVWGVTLVGKV